MNSGRVKVEERQGVRESEIDIDIESDKAGVAQRQRDSQRKGGTPSRGCWPSDLDPATSTVPGPHTAQLLLACSKHPSTQFAYKEDKN